MWVYLRGLIALGGVGTDRDRERLELGLVLSRDTREGNARVTASRKLALPGNIFYIFHHDFMIFG